MQGEGTADNPYLVENADHLWQIKDNTEGNHYLQVADIDLSTLGHEWGEGNFVGGYDGQGYEISNLTMTGAVEEAGLFSYSMPFYLRNINMVDVDINVYYEGSGIGGHTGGVVGYVLDDGEIESCHVKGQVIASGGHVGGVVGCHLGENVSIKDCSFEGEININGARGVGGVAGYIMVGEISDLKADVNWIVTNCFGLGGLIGRWDPNTDKEVLTIQNLNYEGDIEANNVEFLGGLISYYYVDDPDFLLKMENLQYKGNLNYAGSPNAVGGIIGYLEHGYQGGAVQ